MFFSLSTIKRTLVQYQNIIIGAILSGKNEYKFC
jgi:hypothetical protein